DYPWSTFATAVTCFAVSPKTLNLLVQDFKPSSTRDGLSSSAVPSKSFRNFVVWDSWTSPDKETAGDGSPMGSKAGLAVTSASTAAMSKSGSTSTGSTSTGSTSTGSTVAGSTSTAPTGC